MGIRDGEYRGDVPAVRITDDGLAYQKRRLLRGLARLASCERNGDEDLYGAIWQCSRLQLVRIRIKVPGPLVVAAEHIKRGFRASNLYTASDPQEVRNSTASIPRPLVSESWNLGRIRVHLPFIRGFTYCPGAPLGTPSRKYQNKAPLAQSARRVARSIRQISGLL